jgi:transcriptional regulator with XRE-family HTH domain
MHIGLSLAEQRKKLKLSQNALAKKIGVAQSTISYIEKGETNPAFDIVEKIIVDGFNMTLGEFFCGDTSSIDDYISKELISSIQELSSEKIHLLIQVANAMNK